MRIHQENPMTTQAYIARASGTALMVGLLGAMPVAAAPVLFEVGGTAAPSLIQGTVTAFQAALGNPNNGNAPGPLFSGHREINWDGGGGVNTNTVSGTPFNGFLQTRGAIHHARDRLHTGSTLGHSPQRLDEFLQQSDLRQHFRRI
jgi:hypothetical protein